jgi:excisionase family DNA binding protein
MRLLTIAECSQRLALAPNTIRRLIRQGTLPHVRPAGRRAIRVPEAAVEAIVAGRVHKEGVAK